MTKIDYADFLDRKLKELANRIANEKDEKKKEWLIAYYKRVLETGKLFISMFDEIEKEMTGKSLVSEEE